MSEFDSKDLEVSLLQIRLNRKNQDIINIRQRLDMVLDKLDEQTAKVNILQIQIEKLEKTNDDGFNQVIYLESIIDTLKKVAN